MGDGADVHQDSDTVKTEIGASSEDRGQAPAVTVAAGEQPGMGGPPLGLWNSAALGPTTSFLLMLVNFREGKRPRIVEIETLSGLGNNLKIQELPYLRRASLD